MIPCDCETPKTILSHFKKYYSNESRVPDKPAKNHPGSDLNRKAPPAKTRGGQTAYAAPAAGPKDNPAAEYARVKTTVLPAAPG